jgi:hypothetical protein
MLQGVKKNKYLINSSLWVYTKIMQEWIGQRHPKYSYHGREIPLWLILDPASSLSRSFSKSLNQFSSRTHFRYYPMHTHHTQTAVSAYISLVLHEQDGPGNSMQPHLELHINNFKSTCSMRVSSSIRTAFNFGYCTVEDRTQLHLNGQFRTWRWIVKFVIPLHSVKVRKTWSFTSAPSYIFMARC